MITVSILRYGNGYTHAYGSEGYHHYMRNYDPSYNDFYSEGPSVEDKWRSTYPYVPTSYSYNSIDGENTRKKLSKLQSYCRDKMTYPTEFSTLFSAWKEKSQLTHF